MGQGLTQNVQTQVEFQHKTQDQQMVLIQANSKQNLILPNHINGKPIQPQLSTGFSQKKHRVQLTKEQKIAILIQQKINDADSSLNSNLRRAKSPFQNSTISKHLYCKDQLAEQQLKNIDTPNVVLPDSTIQSPVTIQNKSDQLKLSVVMEKQELQKADQTIIKVPLLQSRNLHDTSSQKVQYSELNSQILDQLRKFNTISKIDIYGDQGLKFADIHSEKGYENIDFQQMESRQLQRFRVTNE
ncbi:hypothetical protein SS50377_27012 [Spironucleus salmonicida]|uniref:Uncharacterized protein n=1 Tax=Spironucleus salmonicida TaxID=348837 RepID=V6M2N9_9EUKA|nr:hypothetical protein SS50377_27012 [Spironucleus salmonicida]|eukprot:EST47524.1 Hypothetical protein SS50377_12508 [Spironucleus salmonicida]